MKSQGALVLFMIASFALAEGNFNPSQTTPAQNPSQAAPMPNPSQSAPTRNPSQAIPGFNPSGTLPRPLATPDAPSAVLAPVAPMTPPPNAPRPVPTDAQLIEQVRRAITIGPNAANGFPSLGVNGIPVTDLSITKQNNWVTLRGTVSSDKEKADVGARAAAVVGEQNVVNELTVGP